MLNCRKHISCKVGLNNTLFVVCYKVLLISVKMRLCLFVSITCLAISCLNTEVLLASRINHSTLPNKFATSLSKTSRDNHTTRFTVINTTTNNKPTTSSNSATTTSEILLPQQSGSSSFQPWSTPKISRQNSSTKSQSGSSLSPVGSKKRDLK